MRRILYIVIAFSLLGCNQSNDTKSVVVNLMASGEIQLVPDMAGINVNVSCTNQDLSSSSECIKQSIASLFDLLDEHKVDKQDYHSSSINLEKEFSWKNNSRVFTGYKASSTVNVSFKDLDAMSSVLAKVMLMNSATVYGLNYSHSQLESYSNQAYLKALDNAATLAEEIKTKLSARSVEIFKISNINVGFDGPKPLQLEKAEVASLRANAPSPIQINPGILKLIKNIYVQYHVHY
ncbi:SIMPL domain-containing protein [Pseudomonadota bacterium]